MLVLRRRLFSLAGGCVIVRLLSLGFTCAVLSAGIGISASQECTCAHGDGAVCPMHHTASTSKHPCSCRSTSDDGGAIVASLLGSVAVLPHLSDTMLPNAGST